MPRIRMRLTVFRLLLVVALSAIVFHVATDPSKRRAKEHYERCMHLADWHETLARDYQKGQEGNAGMLKIAAWHRSIRDEFARAAEESLAPVPRSLPFPPSGWTAPAATCQVGIGDHAVTFDARGILSRAAVEARAESSCEREHGQPVRSRL